MRCALARASAAAAQQPRPTTLVLSARRGPDSAGLQSLAGARRPPRSAPL